MGRGSSLSFLSSSSSSSIVSMRERPGSPSPSLPTPHPLVGGSAIDWDTVSSLRCATRCFFSSWFSSARQKKGSATASGSASAREMAEAYTNEASAGLGTQADGGTLSRHMDQSAASRTREDLRRSPPGSTLPPEAMKDLMDLGECTSRRTSRLGRPLPLAYDLEVRRAASREANAKAEVDERHAAVFDARNMPRNPSDSTRKRASWEMEITPEHRALVLLLYRNVLKGLVNFKSIRRRSLIAYARMTFRRRAAATEKLLIDECIEEARRALYVLGKHHAFTETRQYEYDSMTMPKDTGQDVKTYMEEVYDPEISRQQFQHFSDVQPGKEHLHTQRLGPTTGVHHFGRNNSAGREDDDENGNPTGRFKVEIKDEDKAMRPPPPPGMGG